MVIKWNVPVQQSQRANYKTCMYKVLWCFEALHLDIEAFGVGLGASLLHIRGMTYGHEEAPDNVNLCQISFASHNLSSMKQWYNNIEREALGILHGLKNSSLLLCK